jgi:hypothetical protein
VRYFFDVVGVFLRKRAKEDAKEVERAEKEKEKAALSTGDHKPKSQGKSFW